MSVEIIEVGKEGQGQIVVEREVRMELEIGICVREREIRDTNTDRCKFRDITLERPGLRMSLETHRYPVREPRLQWLKLKEDSSHH